MPVQRIRQEGNDEIAVRRNEIACSAFGGLGAADVPVSTRTYVDAPLKVFGMGAPPGI